MPPGKYENSGKPRHTEAGMAGLTLEYPIDLQIGTGIFYFSFCQPKTFWASFFALQ